LQKLNFSEVLRKFIVFAAHALCIALYCLWGRVCL